MLPRLTAEQALRLLELLPEQHFTAPPPRFSEASLVKALEENGIGRPSTYAPTISTLLDRGYIRMEDRRLFPEEIGEVVIDLLMQRFDRILDVGFTAEMEEDLDDIAEGIERWDEVLDRFYTWFHPIVEKGPLEPPEEELDELCPRCSEEGREPGKLVIKIGRYGKFVGCRNYPECKFTRPLETNGQPEPELLDENCPECGKQLMRRVGRYGPFVGCSGYPDCKYVKKEPPKKMGVACPKCKQGELVERRGRFGPFYSCDRYPECDFSINQQPMPDPCPACQGLVVKARGNTTRCTSCGKAWSADGAELSEEEAKALVPKPRAKRAGGKKTAARSGRGGTRTATRARAKAAAANGDDPGSDT
jgi:DNA topoisomerase-1